MHFLEGIKEEKQTAYINAIETAIKLGKIKSEKQAENFAKPYLIDDYANYHLTLVVVPFLSHKVGKIISTKQYKHPYFIGEVTNTIYIDIWGRMWNKTVGVIKKKMKLTNINDEYQIDTLGGGMWRSEKGRTFICEYRTNKSEIKERGAKPETFIG